MPTSRWRHSSMLSGAADITGLLTLTKPSIPYHRSLLTVVKALLQSHKAVSAAGLAGRPSFAVFARVRTLERARDFHLSSTNQHRDGLAYTEPRWASGAVRGALLQPVTAATSRPCARNPCYALHAGLIRSKGQAPAGRMAPFQVTVFGATGFTGTRVARELAASGFKG